MLLAGLSFDSRADLPALSKVTPEGEFAVLNKVYSVVYEITWVGDPDEFIVAPPSIPPIAWGAAEVTRSRTAERDGANMLYYTLEFTAEGPGTYEIPEVVFQYFTPDQVPQPGPAESGAEATAQADTEFPRLQAESIMLTVRAPSTSSVSTTVAIVLLLGGVLAAAWGYRTLRRKGTTTSQADPLAEVSAIMHGAKGKRLDGDYYAFYSEMLKAVQRLEQGTAVRALQTAIGDRTGEVGFKGIRPSDDEMDGVERDVERAVSKELMRAESHTRDLTQIS